MSTDFYYTQLANRVMRVLEDNGIVTVLDDTQCRGAHHRMV